MTLLTAYKIFAATLLLVFLLFARLVDNESRRVRKEIEDLAAQEARDRAGDPAM